MSNVFIICELSANHGHNRENALKTVRAAKVAGADAIKIQTYTPDTLTLDCDNEYFHLKHGTIWDGKTLYQLYEEAFTPWEWHDTIKKEAENNGLLFFSTPFDPTAVDFLESLNVPLYKIASFEITDIPLIKYIAEKKKPILISTGIASIGEIQDAIDICRSVGNDDITLLKCTSAYPADPSEANLLTIPNMAETFGVKVGISDHTMGSSVAIAAVALGATVVEKHFIVDRSIGGPDASFSMEPDEFSRMVSDIRVVEKALGSVDYKLSEKTLKNRIFSRSLFVVRDIKKGELFTKENIRSIRPGFGMSPRYLPDILGRVAERDYERGEPFKW